MSHLILVCPFLGPSEWYILKCLELWSLLLLFYFVGHLDSRSSIRYVLLATSLISLAFTITQGVLEIVSPDEIFHVYSKGFDLFGHGGMLFWFVSSVVFTAVRKLN